MLSAYEMENSDDTGPREHRYGTYENLVSHLLRFIDVIANQSP